jgi:iron-sulfur cluster assembly accessory protein
MTDTAVRTAAHGVGLTDAAAEKVRTLLGQEGRDDLRLRLAVQPGGCSGLIYQLYFDERSLDGDAAVEFAPGVEVVVDKMSVPYVDGATTHRVVARVETASTSKNFSLKGAPKGAPFSPFVWSDSGHSPPGAATSCSDSSL